MCNGAGCAVCGAARAAGDGDGVEDGCEAGGHGAVSRDGSGGVGGTTQGPATGAAHAANLIAHSGCNSEGRCGVVSDHLGRVGADAATRACTGRDGVAPPCAARGGGAAVAACARPCVGAGACCHAAGGAAQAAQVGAGRAGDERRGGVGAAAGAVHDGLQPVNRCQRLATTHKTDKQVGGRFHGSVRDPAVKVHIVRNRGVRHVGGAGPLPAGTGRTARDRRIGESPTDGGVVCTAQHQAFQLFLAGHPPVVGPQVVEPVGCGGLLQGIRPVALPCCGARDTGRTAEAVHAFVPHQLGGGVGHGAVAVVNQRSLGDGHCQHAKGQCQRAQHVL